MNAYVAVYMSNLPEATMQVEGKTNPLAAQYGSHRLA
jgi:hypothetical protein